MLSWTQGGRGLRPRAAGPSRSTTPCSTASCGTTLYGSGRAAPWTAGTWVRTMPIRRRATRPDCGHRAVLQRRPAPLGGRAAHPAAGGQADWEDGGLYKPWLLEHDGLYLFYNAKERAGRAGTEQTGLATSPDLVHWTRYEGTPSSPARRRVSSTPFRHCASCTTRASGGCSTTGWQPTAIATAPPGRDLRHWTKSGEILVDDGAPGSSDAVYARPASSRRTVVLYHYYCAVSHPRGRAGRDRMAGGIAVAHS